MPDTGSAFIDASRTYLREEYLPKIAYCLDQLDEDDIWWRPNDASNSIGNLILHLAGNARQWVVHGIGGASDVRDRAREFDAGETQTKAELLQHLRSTLKSVDAALALLNPDTLHETRTIQGLERTVLEALYHVVEHFATHTGQIVYITKLRTGADLGFYSVDEDGDVTTNW
ncbi:MAG: DUF1572 domain-containing protein [Bacteroidetes bacterium]|jgi:uncharacterized damage-inducible protein DinB|nr:DUF1572 domain-containing protein [Bacteroidota bacterium]